MGVERVRLSKSEEPVVKQQDLTEGHATLAHRRTPFLSLEVNDNREIQENDIQHLHLVEISPDASHDQYRQ